MKFVCPVCQTAGEIAEGDSDRPAVKTSCLKCGTTLSIERETGRVQSPADGTQASGPRPTFETSSVLSMSPRDGGKKDYTAIGIFAVVLALLIGAGVYFTLNIERDVLNQPLQKFSRLVEDVSRYGKTIIDQFQKVRQPKSRENRLVKKHVRKGYEHYKANRQKQALEEFGQAIEIDPQNAEAYFWRARAFIRLGQFDDAMTDLNAVVKLNPRYSPAYDNLGWLQMRRNQLDESLIHLNKSIELNPDNGWAHHMRSRIFFKKGDLQNALKNAKAACKLGYKDACRDAKSYESQLAEKDQ